MELKDTIMGQITKDALMNWNELTEEEAERKVQDLGTVENARDNVTYGSEIAAIEGIAKVVELSDEEKETLTEAIYTQDSVPEKIAEKMREKLSVSKSVIGVLSYIHDNWVRDNGNKFDGRMKNYQFVDLRLMPFGNDGATADLLFVKPILEAAGIEINMDELEGSFEMEQRELLEVNGIDSMEKLTEKIAEGTGFYPALEGVQTNRTGEATEISEEGVVREEGKTQNITDVLKEQPEVSKKMARQVWENIRVSVKKNRLENQVSEMKRNRSTIESKSTQKSMEQRIKQYILRHYGETPRYGFIVIEDFIDPGPGWTKTYLGNKKIVASSHEYDLSQKFGVPFKDLRDRITYVHSSHPFYEDEKVHSVTFEEANQQNIEIQKRIRKTKRMQEEVRRNPMQYQQAGQIVVNGYNIPITRQELIEAGLDPKMFGWKAVEQVKSEGRKEQGIVTPKSIAHNTRGLPKRAIESVRSLFSREKDERGEK